MVHYIQRECNSSNVISSGAILKFETPIALSQTNSLTPPEDFEYQENGSIDVFRAGTYSIFWYVANMTSQSAIGQSYQIEKLDYSLEPPNWVSVVGTSNHIKVSQTPGFAVLDILQEEINDFGKATVAIFNTADAQTELTFFVPKAGILIFGLSTESLENKLTTIDGQIADVASQVDGLEQFVHLSEISEIWSETEEILGVGAAVIRSGYTYNFWGIGALSQPQTLVADVDYFIIDSTQFVPLQQYVGAATIGTLWIDTQTVLPDTFSLPIRFDSTGIYFKSDINYDLPAGAVLRFTQALILVGG